jgi:hypothetical protein
MSLVVVAATTTASAVPAAATLSTTAAGPVCLRPGLIDLERASANFSSIQRRHGLIGFVCIGHFHEGKTARAPSFPVGDDAHSFDGSVGFKQRAEFGFRRAVREVTNKKILHYISSSF